MKRFLKEHKARVCIEAIILVMGLCLYLVQPDLNNDLNRMIGTLYMNDGKGLSMFFYAYKNHRVGLGIGLGFLCGLFPLMHLSTLIDALQWVFGKRIALLVAVPAYITGLLFLADMILGIGRVIWFVRKKQV